MSLIRMREQKTLLKHKMKIDTIRFQIQFGGYFSGSLNEKENKHII